MNDGAAGVDRYSIERLGEQPVNRVPDFAGCGRCDRVKGYGKGAFMAYRLLDAIAAERVASEREKARHLLAHTVDASHAGEVAARHLNAESIVSGYIFPDRVVGAHHCVQARASGVVYSIRQNCLIF